MSVANGAFERGAWLPLVVVGPGLDRRARGVPDADLHAPRLRLDGLGDPHRQHAVVQRRGDALGVDALGQAERARERAGRPLDAVVALVALLVLGLALAGDR